MKVAWFHKFGGPEVLVHEEAPKPAPKPGEHRQNLGCRSGHRAPGRGAAHAGGGGTCEPFKVTKGDLEACENFEVAFCDLKAELGFRVADCDLDRNSVSTSSGAIPCASVRTVTVGAVRSGKTSTGSCVAV